MNRENKIITFPEQIPQTQTGSGRIPPRRRMPTARGLVDDVPEVFKQTFTKEQLDPTIRIIKTHPLVFHEINSGTIYLLHTKFYEK